MKSNKSSASSLGSAKGQRVFSGPQLLQVAMPMGGLGAGCVCLAGHGAVQDFAIRNKPAFSAMPDGHTMRDDAFAILHIKGAKPITRLLEGPMPPERIYDQGLQAQGYRHGGHEGMPRFEKCTFTGEYPFGHVKLSHPGVPLKVNITGFNPFIPLDDKNSGLPCAILEYTFQNTSSKPVAFEFSYHMSHMATGKTGVKSTRNSVIPDLGVSLYNTDPANAPTFASAALGVIGAKPKVKAMWFRGGWFDPISALWREVSTGSFTENVGNTTEDIDGCNGGSILIAGRLAPGKSVTYPIVIAWYFPNCPDRCGWPTDSTCAPGCNCTTPVENPPPAWKPWYTTQWKDAADVLQYVRANYASLRSRTLAFRQALASSTLPPSVLDAVASNLAILKSPTFLRQSSGNVWGWEGCSCEAGCCHGTCTHVWNYAQAMPHLFPALERTLREQELERSMDQRGHVTFRAAIPDGPTDHGFHAAADGQLGGIMKLYRDWHISGDRQWLGRMYPLAKQSLDYCIGLWDPQRQGALFEPHHNTYDIEFWGPDGMCTSIYVGALAAMAGMANELGFSEDARSYGELATRGARFLDEHLFNGEYFHQKVLWNELKDQSFAQKIAKVDAKSSEMDRLLKAEGPKYQYGTGCLADGVIGAWMAKIYGVDTPQNAAHIRSTLAAIFKHNFKKDLFDHVSTQRPGYAMGHEPGLLLCSWPRGGKPTLPFVYSDEVWTGIEYQVASHLIEEGMVDEGLRIVEAVRSRYEGHVRNPFNEYECGSYYARAMASYAILNSLSGFRYSAVTRTLHLAPKLKAVVFRAFFSTVSGFGVLSLKGSQLRVEMVEGELALDHVELTTPKGKLTLSPGVVAKAGKPCVFSMKRTVASG